jgi:hypothetical protein
MGSLFTVLLVAMVSLMVYAMIPFRAHGARTPAAPSASAHGAVTSVAARSSGKSTTPPAGPSASTRISQGAKTQAAPTAAGP